MSNITFCIVPADDLCNRCAAGYDGNKFDTREEAEKDIPNLAEVTDTTACDWTVVAYDGDLLLRNPSFAALVGSDGFRPVVWGVGFGNNFKAAEHAARSDADNWLDNADDPEGATFEIVAISEKRYFSIKSGNVDAEDLVHRT